MSIKAIIFDFFGVISSEVSPFWFAERFSPDEAKILKDKYMTPADRGDVTEEELFESLSQVSGDSPSEIEKDFERKTVIDKDMVEYIKALGQSYKLVLLSNALASWLRKILTKHNLEELFDLVIISSEVGMIKPDKKIFDLALERIGVKAEEAIFIDDNEKNTDGAKSVGINAVVFCDLEELKYKIAKISGNL